MGLPFFFNGMTYSVYGKLMIFSYKMMTYADWTVQRGPESTESEWVSRVNCRWSAAVAGAVAPPVGSWNWSYRRSPAPNWTWKTAMTGAVVVVVVVVVVVGGAAFPCGTGSCTGAHYRNCRRPTTTGHWGDWWRSQCRPVLRTTSRAGSDGPAAPAAVPFGSWCVRIRGSFCCCCCWTDDYLRLNDGRVNGQKSDRSLYTVHVRSGSASIIKYDLPPTITFLMHCCCHSWVGVIIHVQNYLQ